MKHFILGYAMDRSLPGFTEADARRLTHLNLAFGLIRDGVVDMSMLPHMELVPRFRTWDSTLKIILSIGGWGAGGFSAMAMTESGRRAFAASCLDVVEQYGLDGIDIDWEYPCSDQVKGNKSSANAATRLASTPTPRIGRIIRSCSAPSGRRWVLAAPCP